MAIIRLKTDFFSKMIVKIDFFVLFDRFHKISHENQNIRF